MGVGCGQPAPPLPAPRALQGGEPRGGHGEQQETPQEAADRLDCTYHVIALCFYPHFKE